MLEADLMKAARECLRNHPQALGNTRLLVFALQRIAAISTFSPNLLGLGGLILCVTSTDRRGTVSECRH